MPVLVGSMRTGEQKQVCRRAFELREGSWSSEMSILEWVPVFTLTGHQTGRVMLTVSPGEAARAQPVPVLEPEVGNVAVEAGSPQVQGLGG
jgi:hypothetical protein